MAAILEAQPKFEETPSGSFSRRCGSGSLLTDERRNSKPTLDQADKISGPERR